MLWPESQKTYVADIDPPAHYHPEHLTTWYNAEANIVFTYTRGVRFFGVWIPKEVATMTWYADEERKWLHDIRSIMGFTRS
jgi:hypothetical protein